MAKRGGNACGACCRPMPPTPEPTMPPSLQNLWPWAAVLTVGLVLCGCVLAQPRPSAASSTREVPAAQVDRFGDLEVVTHARHYRTANHGTQGTTHDW